MDANQPAKSRTVVVVGAGPGGSVAALLLAATGWSVTLLERVSEPTAVGAGLLLQPNGLAVLDALARLALAGAVRGPPGAVVVALFAMTALGLLRPRSPVQGGLPGVVLGADSVRISWVIG